MYIKRNYVQVDKQCDAAQEMVVEQTRNGANETYQVQLRWLVDWLVYWLVDWLVDWLVGWLVDWLVGWLVDWLVDRIVDWLVN